MLSWSNETFKKMDKKLKQEINKNDNISIQNNNTDAANIVLLMNQLKLAIQNGDLPSFNEDITTQHQHKLHNNNNSNTSTSKSTINNNDNVKLNQQQYQTIYTNVNNLSNQTFNYIINWLKQQNHAVTMNTLNEVSFFTF